jgi:hypothetical protein
MARDATTKLTAKVPARIETTPEAVSQAKRPNKGRYLLQVDRQTKESFATVEAAEEAGMKIKVAFPIVKVAVYDSIDFVNKSVELPSS